MRQDTIGGEVAINAVAVLVPGTKEQLEIAVQVLEDRSLCLGVTVEEVHKFPKGGHTVHHMPSSRSKARILDLLFSPIKVAAMLVAIKVACSKTATLPETIPPPPPL